MTDGVSTSGAADEAVAMSPAHPFKRDPVPPHALRERFTPRADVFVLCHLGVARIERSEWGLAIDGLVERPLRLCFEDLAGFPRCELSSVHQCCGSPLAPREPTRRVTQVRWGGVRLEDVLARARPLPEARFVWSRGADHGEFAGVSLDGFVKDLPLERVGRDVLLADELNGEALSAELGAPVRLVVPGFYGTNSVKWLRRLTLARERVDSPFTRRWYNDPVLDARGRETAERAPVWAIAPESVIVSPAPGALVERGRACEIWGWAWADAGVCQVEVRTDAGARTALLEPVRGHEWQRFALEWVPEQSGAVRLSSRARARDGAAQPDAGARNARYEVALSVR